MMGMLDQISLKLLVAGGTRLISVHSLFDLFVLRQKGQAWTSKSIRPLKHSMRFRGSVE